MRLVGTVVLLLVPLAAMGQSRNRANVLWDQASVLGKNGSLGGPLADVMTKSPTTLTVSETVERALELMQKGGYRHLPVLDDCGMVKGVLSVKRIVHWLVEHFPTVVYTLPPDTNRASALREGA